MTMLQTFLEFQGIKLDKNVEILSNFSCAGLTYNELADDLLKFAIASSRGAKRIDIVLNVYRDDSIRNAERGHPSTGKLQFKTIVGSSVIKQWGVIRRS